VRGAGLHILVLIGVIVLMVLGLIATFIPVLPGNWLVFLGVFLYGLYDHFQVVTWPFVGVVLVLTLLATVLDYLAGLVGARRVKASRSGEVGAVVGGIVGIFVFGPLGVVLGPFLGAITGEVAAGRSSREAFRVGFGAVVGVMGGVLIKVLIAGAVIVMFILRVT